MWGRFGRMRSGRGEAVKSRFITLGTLRGRFGRKEPEQERPIYGGAVGLGVAALAVLAALSLLLLLLRRRSRGQGDSIEEVDEEMNTENASENEDSPG